MKILSTLLIVGMAIMTVSCCSCRKGSPQVGDLESAKWELIEFNNEPVTGTPITLTFDGEKKMMYGTAPCNGFFGGYSLFDQPDNIKISAVGATRKFCDGIMKLEENFTSKITQVTRVKMEGKNMLMMDTNGNLIAVFSSTDK